MSDCEMFSQWSVLIWFNPIHSKKKKKICDKLTALYLPGSWSWREINLNLSCMQTHAATDHQDKQAEHTSIMEIALQNTALVSSLPRIQSNSLLTSATFQTYTFLGSCF